MQLEKRVAALEAKDTRPYRWVWRNHGETEAVAMARARILPPDSVLIFSWREPDANT